MGGKEIPDNLCRVKLPQWVFLRQFFRKISPRPIAVKIDKKRSAANKMQNDVIFVPP